MKRLTTGIRKLAFGGLLAVLAVSALARIVSAGLETLPDADAPEGESANTAELLCPPSQEVENLLRQIAQRDASLEAREQQVALREQDIRVAEQEIRAALSDLTEAEQRLEERMYQSNIASETDIAQLTEVYQGMKPKDAAVLFEAMEANFASGFLARMRPDAAAAIFSNLSPEKAYALSVVMAGRNANAATE